MLKRLLRHRAIHALLTAILARYLAFALRTTRWTLHGAEHVAPQMAGAPAIAAFWHERLPLMLALWRRVQAGGRAAETSVLVSRHSDGRFIGELMRGFGVRVVYGSTARNGQSCGGATVARQMLERLQAGGSVVITPDGPRGPRRQAAPGVAQLAAMSGVAVLPCAAQTSARYVLRSWDRMVLPLPFGRGVIVCLPPVVVARDGADAALADIAAAMSQAADLADRLCPR